MLLTVIPVAASRTFGGLVSRPEPVGVWAWLRVDDLHQRSRGGADSGNRPVRRVCPEDDDFLGCEAKMGCPTVDLQMTL